MTSEIQHIAQDEQYQHLLNQVVERAKLFRYRTSIGMNQELIRFYWSIGEDMAVAKAETKWGSNINQMYRLFTSESIIAPQPVAQLPTAENSCQAGRRR